MSHSNLTDAEMERLVVLAEECAEVIQAIAKIQRRGYDAAHPDGGPDNRRLLEVELGDVMAALALMENENDVSDVLIAAAKREKLKRLRHFLYHQRPGLVLNCLATSREWEREEFTELEAKALAAQEMGNEAALAEYAEVASPEAMLSIVAYVRRIEGRLRQVREQRNAWQRLAMAQPLELFPSREAGET